MYRRDEHSTGNSNWQGDAYLVELIHLYHPQSILDLGVGKWAKMGNLIRRSYDEWLWIQYGEAQIRIYGVEGDELNIRYVNTYFPNLYDEIAHREIYEYLRESENIDRKTIDIVILGDVLEHFKKEKAYGIIEMCRNLARKAILVQLPLGIYPQTIEGHPLEEHKSSWFPEDIQKLRPAGLRKFTDFSGRDFVVFSIPI